MTLSIITGATGGLGRALADALEHTGHPILRLGRTTTPPLDLLNESTIAQAATQAAALGDIRLLLDATGFLHNAQFRPERSLKELDPAHMAHAFAINAIGPALLLKHFVPAFPRKGRVVFATLSARVGSIADNRLGGWYSYRAAKAALNQLVHTAAIELRRHNPDAICVALHPGTVDTPLSTPFAKRDLNTRPPDIAARDILAVIAGLTPAHTGGFFDQTGAPIPW